MRKEQLKELQTLGKEHFKIKNSILEMCDSLDATKDLKDKEAIKRAIDKSNAQLNNIEEAYKAILNTIPIKENGRN